MRLTESSEDVLHSFTDRGLDWSEACIHCAEEAADARAQGDRESFVVWRDRAEEIDAFMRARRRTMNVFDDGA